MWADIVEVGWGGGGMELNTWVRIEPDLEFLEGGSPR